LAPRGTTAAFDEVFRKRIPSNCVGEMRASVEA
jgi:hypothetical protein